MAHTKTEYRRGLKKAEKIMKLTTELCEKFGDDDIISDHLAGVSASAEEVVMAFEYEVQG